MCGLAGLVLVPPGPVKSEWLERMLDQLTHRGPDDGGWTAFFRGQISAGHSVPADLMADAVLIHRRLSILDLSHAARQPMPSADRRYWIVFNGEIYNYLELRTELEALGHVFSSRSDTEVLLVALATWGTDALRRLVGMFALAFLDRRTRRLLLARDPFGIKPLYYARWQDGFAFASEIPTLLELPGIDRAPNPRRLYGYLRSGATDHGDETFFDTIRQLPAAHYADVSLDEPWDVEPTRYWQLAWAEKSDLSFDAAAETLRDLFLENIRLHLRSDVPVGAALSGGIDSSSIVSAMRLLCPKLELHAVSYIAEDRGLSEETWVDVVAKAAGVLVHKVKVSSTELFTDLNRLIARQGEPFPSTSIYAQWRVFQAAREAGIKVMLDGQGADELLGGYPIYRIAQIRAFLRRGEWSKALELWRYAMSPAAEGLSWVTPRVFAEFVPGRMKDAIRQLVRGDVTPEWLDETWFRDRGWERTPDPPGASTHVLTQTLHRTLTETSLPQLLRYEDRNSMAFSIESRVPFLTPNLAQFIFALPEEYLIAPNGTTKAVFRQAMRGIVPDMILDRKDKKGFPTPQDQWLTTRQDTVTAILNSDAAERVPGLHRDAMRSEWQAVVRGAKPAGGHLWRWINLIVWTEQFAVAST